MMTKAKRRQFFDGVYDILVTHGKATESMRAPFLHHHTEAKIACEEWRFEGLLGFGGKYRSAYNKVDCYAEDLNPKRRLLIDKINQLLVELRNTFKPIVYVDMDGVLADYNARRDAFGEEATHQPGFFRDLEPIQDAIAGFKTLVGMGCNVYILSTAPWSNPSAWSEKRLWVEEHLGEDGFKRLILSHHKNLLKGEYLIDDRIANGVDGFEGKHIHFGSATYPNWVEVVASLRYSFTHEFLL